MEEIVVNPLKVFVLFLAILMLFAVACGNEGKDPEQQPSDNTPSVSKPEQPEQPETPSEVTLDLFVDGASDYTLVYDDSDPYIVAQVENFVHKLKVAYRVELAAVAVSEADADYGKEIVVGNVRDSAAVVSAQLNDTNDFAMCVVEDDWVLLATNGRLYQYLFEVVDKRELSRIENGSLTRSSDRDFIYHTSYLKNKSYLNYAKPSEGYNTADLLNFFEARKYQAKDGTKIPYRLYVPYDYDPAKDYPVLLILHGAGERGDNNTSQMVHVVGNLFNTSKTPVTDAIIVCPQCPGGNQWVDTPWANGSYSTEKVNVSNELRAVINLLDELSDEYSTDIDRYYVMGLSMGGFGTWDLLMRYPDVFAAGIPICGGADPSMAAELVDMPIWTFHGSADDVVPVSGTREMVAALQEAGSTAVIYEEIEGAGHGIWGTVASRRDVINWLFEQNYSNR